MSNENKNEALAPCRFCGSTYAWACNPLEEAWSVHCPDCCAKGPSRGSEAAAVAAWNDADPGVGRAKLPTQVRWPGGKFAQRNGDEYAHIVGSEHMSVRQMPSGTWQAAYTYKSSTMRVCAPDPQTAADHCVVELEKLADGWAPWVFEERARLGVEVSELQAKIHKIGTALGISHGSFLCQTMTDAEYAQQVINKAMGHAAEKRQFEENHDRLAAVTTELERLRSHALALEDERDEFARRLRHLSSVEEGDKAGKSVDWLIEAKRCIEKLVAGSDGEER